MAVRKSMYKRKKFKDLRKRKFHRLRVLRLDPETEFARRARWICRCKCGSVKSYCAATIQKGTSKSCGCLRKEVSARTNRTHGMTHTSEYEIWCGIIKRCSNSASANFRIYGSRGIKVCSRWRKSFEAFFADMGSRPSSKYSIERKDNDGDYTPNNCVWATRPEQSRNTRRNIMLTFQGKTQCLTDWARQLGIPRCVLHTRIRTLGWSVKRALTELVR